MSATQDKTQKVTFIYQNFHKLYKKGQEAAKSAELPASVTPPTAPSRTVLKVEDLNSPSFGVVRPGLRIDAYSPPEFIGKRVAKPTALPAAAPAYKPAVAPAANPAIQSLKDNLKNLNDLHGRLRFMLQELEELIKADQEE